MKQDRDSIAWNTEQIREMANQFEGRYLPIGMVGAIEGYCNNIDRIAARLQRLELVTSGEED
jgi:hypothetical protein